MLTNKGVSKANLIPEKMLSCVSSGAVMESGASPIPVTYQKAIPAAPWRFAALVNRMRKHKNAGFVLENFLSWRSLIFIVLNSLLCSFWSLSLETVVTSALFPYQCPLCLLSV